MVGLSLSETARKQSVDEIWTIHVELHSKDQSRTNQRWSFHDFYRMNDGTYEEFYMEPTIKTKIKTRNYNCYEERDVEHTKCLDDVYMSKLNCTFPWLESTRHSQEICGSKHFIMDLYYLIDDVSTGA